MSNETSSRPRLVTVQAVKSAGTKAHIVRRIAGSRVFLACGQWVWPSFALDPDEHAAPLCAVCKANS